MTDTVLCLTFRSGGRRFALPVSGVREAARRPRIAKLPGAPSRCAGLAMVRGAPVGILELDGGASAEEASFVVVLEGRPYALLVDRIDGVEPLPVGQRVVEGVSLLDVDAVVPPAPVKEGGVS